MYFQNPIFLQIALDIALFAAVLILLWRVNVNIKKPLLDFPREMIAELKTLIAESQTNADNFLQALEQSRLALKEIALELELKEKRVKTILEKAEREDKSVGKRTVNKPATFSPGKYSEVIDMIKEGYSEEETARVTGFTEAEIGLIIDLSRIKNENS
jgi:DNA-binding CsgD family transcriptional regulator